MKILADENTPKLTIQTLRALGHDTLDVRRTANKSAPDDALWRVAQSEQRLVISTDRHFARYRAEQHSGILLVFLHYPDEMKVHRRFMYALVRFSEKRWRNLTVVVKDEVMNVWREGGWTQYKLPKLLG